MTRHMVSFRMTGELIAQALRMPAGTKIYDITRRDGTVDQFTFLVEHPDLPEVPEGGEPVKVTPTVSSVEWDWGLE